MKILQISTELVHSGAEKIVYDLSTNLKYKEHEVTVACVKDVRGEIGNWLESKQIPVYWVDLNYRNPLKFIINIFKFVFWVRKEKFDLLHAHQFHANVIGRLAVFFSKSKLVSTVHLVERRFRPWHFWFDSLTAFLCKKEICVSKAVKVFTEHKTSFMKKKLVVIYNGINSISAKSENIDNLKSKLEMPKNKFIYGAVGRLNLQKGFCYLIDAFAEILKEIPDSYLFIVGEGVERQNLEALIKKNSIGENVKLVGYSKDVHLYYQVMDGFIMPSLFEGFGLVAAEALMYEVPVVATNVDSLPEIIQHEKTGILIDKQDIEALTLKMKYLQEHQEKVLEWARQGKSFIEENFSMENMINSHIDLYHSVMNIKSNT
ncbi:MAG: hypothetical protein COA79_14670 [Planctomycetota bacterium]|nr:MAG: hypothetical protein COA79_14670 [Planctomycetota bacterium]